MVDQLRIPIHQVSALIIGDEILSGLRQDAHMPFLINWLPTLGIKLSQVNYVGDDASELEQALEASRNRGDITFCFGGIGATPDDRTRYTAAKLFSRPLTRHPEAERQIRNRFGEEAEPYRVRMADLPRGCDLIPNDATQIPGFYLENHYFFPGFPEMAQSMLQQLMQTHFAPPGHPTSQLTVLQVISPESDLVPIMEQLQQDHPHCAFFSLPQFDPTAPKLLGFRSQAPDPAVLKALQEALERAQIPWQEAKGAP
uniref:Molybdopterin binding domain n=1 Tax=Magnetococcus massalia (strain MO-1) TaxID=451514 RepID=A0A1S7LE72_MAGMO|nr:Molybdopterin binding domain [Candidatus Magnetococcus massalia]